MADVSYETLLESLFDGVYFVDLDRRIAIWNKSAERITGYTKEEVVGDFCHANILRHIDDKGRELCLNGCPLSATMRDGKPREASVFLHHKLGHRVPVSVRTSPVREASGAIVGAIEIFTDNSKALEILKELEGLKQEAYLDKLTNVGNRRYGENTLGTCIFQWQSHGTSFGVIFLDIDYFKKLNDSAGHKAGDDMLVMVGQTILNTVRRFDIVSRWGGEEFVVILPSITAELLTVVAERIRVFIESSFIMADDRKLSITASLGATLVEPDDTPETIVHRADTLMYASKTAGRNRVTIG
jgi:diguanylate cyclase (GGDEF)-like protein/PAS domain S-box-containing protein